MGSLVVSFVILHRRRHRIRRFGGGSGVLLLSQHAIAIDVELEERFLVRGGGVPRAILADEESIGVEDPGVYVQAPPSRTRSRP